MKNYSELSYINALMNEKLNENELRAEILLTLEGLKYWLYRLGF